MMKLSRIRSMARLILIRMNDGTYAEDMDQMRQDAEELALTILATNAKTKHAGTKRSRGRKR